MGLTSRKKKAYNQSYYKSNKDSLLDKQKQTAGHKKETKRKWYVQNSHKIVHAYRKIYLLNPDPKKSAERDKYAAQPELKRKLERERYASHPEPKRQLERERYASQPEPKRQLERERYASQPEPKRQLERERYAFQRELKRKLKREMYASQPEPKKKLEREKYAANPIAKRSADKMNYSMNRDNRKSNMLKRYRECKSQVLLHRKCAYYKSAQARTAAKLLKRAKKNVSLYSKTSRHNIISLHEPNQLTRELYAKLMKHTISRDSSLRKDLEISLTELATLVLVRFRAYSHTLVFVKFSTKLSNRENCVWVNF